MASAYGGHATLPTVSASAEVNSCSGLSLTNNTTLTVPPPSNQNGHQNNNSNNNSSSHSHSSSLRQQDEQMHLVEAEHSTTSPLMGQQQQQRLQQNDLLNSNNHSQQQHLHSGISVTENLTNGEGRVMQSFTINSLNGRCSPTASGSSGGGSRSSAHSLPSHSPALHLSSHNAQLTAAAYQTHQGSLDACGPTTVVTSAAIMGRLTAGCVDTLGNAGSNAANTGFNTIDGCSNDTLSLLQHHHHHHHAPSHHFSYSTLTPPHHHHHPLHHHPHNHHHHPHDAPGLLDISTL
ncbi:lateral signaling target protein 2 homolog [Lucilia cuprina]|uniref:lateral signaling target protein 2 homolog n=1 Tax=Lucilia cuprina TaxID=7375 RepID=UPI001F06BD05|nr:lateral signaling target protein 2 homolog [Lucilia cuprina]